jgi:putative ABC transport system ATP-binding protein
VKRRIIQREPKELAEPEETTEVVVAEPAGSENGAAPNSVRLESVSKVYGSGQNSVPALRELSLKLAKGSFTAVMGPSGSGKSTFLHCAAGLDRPSSGSIHLGDRDLGTLSEDALSRLRRERIGFVFQSFNLVPSLTAAQNITLPLRLAKRKPNKAWLQEVIARVGLADRVTHKPGELSGGQQQRVAIARALVAQPEVIFADEPTGALDTRTGKDILSLLREAVDGLDQTVVMVTHDPVAAAYADTVVFLADGQIVETMENPSSERVAEQMTHLGD